MVGVGGLNTGGRLGQPRPRTRLVRAFNFSGSCMSASLNFNRSTSSAWFQGSTFSILQNGTPTSLASIWRDASNLACLRHPPYSSNGHALFDCGTCNSCRRLLLEVLNPEAIAQREPSIESKECQAMEPSDFLHRHVLVDWLNVHPDDCSPKLLRQIYATVRQHHCCTEGGGREDSEWRGCRRGKDARYWRCKEGGGLGRE